MSINQVTMNKNNLRIIAKIIAVMTFIYCISVNFWGPCGDNMYWRYNVFSHTLTVSGSGKMDNYYVPEFPRGGWVLGLWHRHNGNNCPPWSYFDGIQRVVVKPAVSSLGCNCFADCDQMKEVDLPDTLKSIGAPAFYGCGGLKAVRIPSSVKTIGEYAFLDTGVRRLVVPKHTYIELEESYKESYIGPVKIIRK